MDDYAKTFIEELRALEEPTKRKVLVVSTVVIMIVVIYFWLAYFNGIIASAGQPAAEGQEVQTAQAAPTRTGPGFWANVGNGAAIVYQSFAGDARWVASLFEAPKQINIQGQ